MNLRKSVGLLVVVTVFALGIGIVGLPFLSDSSRSVESSQPLEITETPNGDPYRLVPLERPTELGTLTQTLEIGLEEGPDSYLFGFIADIAVGSDGRVAVVRLRARGSEGRQVHGDVVKGWQSS